MPLHQQRYDLHLENDLNHKNLVSYNSKLKKITSAFELRSCPDDIFFSVEQIVSEVRGSSWSTMESWPS